MSLRPRTHGRFVLPAAVFACLLIVAALPSYAAALVQPASCSGKRLTAGQRTRDADHDRRANWRDADVDGDRRPNGRDTDVDGDRRANARDTDVDGDGLLNGADRDVDGDGVANERDRDVDGDGRLNGRDTDIDGDTILNARDGDLDGDCVVNGRDPDSDGDGVPDPQDASAFGAAPAAKVQSARAATISPVPASFFGLVANEAMGRNGAAQDDVLAQIRAAGAGTLRQKLDWASVERAPGQYSWGAFDALVLSAARAGVEVLPILFNPPAFASSDPQADGTAPPRDNEVFASFAAAAVRRYGPSGALWAAHPDAAALPIHAWQVWNEPNFKAYWPSGPDAAAYVRMLRTVGASIKGADAGAEVVAAGLPDSYSGISVADFVEQMYAAGGRGAFDTLAVHPYARSAEQAVAILEGARAVLDRHGDSGVPIWATELGWATDGPAAPYQVGVEAQAALVERTLSMLVAQREHLGLRGVIYYDWQDCGPYEGGSDFWGLHTGLHGVDGTAKPALASFTRTTHALTAGA